MTNPLFLRYTAVLVIAIYLISMIAAPFARASTLGVTTRVDYLQQGLLVWYTMDGATLAKNVADQSPNGYNGYLSLGTKGNLATTTAPGVIGQSIVLDGVDDHIDVPNGPTAVKTVSFWEKVSTSTTQGFISLNVGTSVTSSSTGAVNANGFTSPTLYVDDGSGPATIDKNWHMITVITNTPVNASSGLIVGQGLSMYCGCKIDGVRLYDRILSQAEISLLYIRGIGKTRAKTVTGPVNLIPGLVGWWTFDGTNVTGTTTANDVSGNGKNGTTFNFGATVATSSTWNTIGSGTWTAPGGVIVVKAEVWGAGGGGGGGQVTRGAGAGGGGGAYARINSFKVRPGNIYNFYVGKGGSGGSSAGVPPGGTGENSMFNASSTVLAIGGPGGPGALSGTGTSSVATSTGSIGDNIFFGGNGGNGVTGAAGPSGAGGGGAGSAGNGGVASGGTAGAGGSPDGGTGATGLTAAGAGTAGTAYGGGGSGGLASNSVSQPGGAGANGGVRITGYYGLSGWSPGRVGQGVTLDGTASYISFGNVSSNVETVSFWFRASTSTTQKLLDLNGTQTITISSNTVTANSFNSPVIYVDGAVASALSDTKWHLITIASSSPINASAVNLGLIGSTYCGCSFDDLRFYNRTLSATEVSQIYALGAKNRVAISSLGAPRTTTNLLAWYTMDGPDIFSNIADKAGTFTGDLMLGSSGSLATTTAPGKMGQALTLDGVDDYISVGTGPSAIQTVSFWMKTATSTDQYIIDLDGGLHTIAASSTVTVKTTGFSSPTIYVDGSVSSTINKNWHLITVTTATPVNATALKIGKVNSSVCGCTLDDVRLYSSVLSASDIMKLYQMGH